MRGPQPRYQVSPRRGPSDIQNTDNHTFAMGGRGFESLHLHLHLHPSPPDSGFVVRVVEGLRLVATMLSVRFAMQSPASSVGSEELQLASS